MRSLVQVTIAFFALAMSAAPARAHPVPRSSHDRTIVVRIQPSAKPDHLAIRVDYRLEVDEATVLLEDMHPYRDEVDFTKYRNKPLAFYAEYARIYAPLLAERLLGKINDKPFTFTDGKRTQQLADETGQPLGHLRCDFTFHAEVPIDPRNANTLWFRDANFLLQDGKILVSYANPAGLTISKEQVPSKALQERPLTEWEPGDEEKLRRLSVVFIPKGGTAAVSAEPAPTPAAAPNVVADAAPAEPAGGSSLFDDESSLMWIIASDHGFWWKMLLATVFGAAHALTPGHGKTLVAAYLIGERGTVWHACVLGIVTTLTHTGAVLILGAVVFFLPEESRSAFAASLTQGLGLATGLLVIGLGAWLLLQRLAGRPDHIHLGGDHGHSHSQGHGHSHGHSHSHGLPLDTNVRWPSLIMLGITGGLIPCADAVLLFILFMGSEQAHLVLPALICFSIGLAFVLVLLGVLVVRVPRFASSRFGESRFVHSPPIISATIIIGIGFWLCYKTVGAN
jgi:ABC-type nickel/cobalt efflux system permease component RcnA